MRNTIIAGDVVKSLNTIPDDSVDCIITSPPYFGLRDYGNDAQIGHEESFSAYIDTLLDVTRECRRILKPTGTLFWNHGDSYSSKSKIASGGRRCWKYKYRMGTSSAKDR